MIVRGGELRQDVVEECDVCVVGTGAGGAVAAKELAEAGRAVVALEAGPAFSPDDFTNRESDLLPRLFWESGFRTTADQAILIYQGRGVGGSTVHNQCYAVPTPQPILDLWAERFGLRTLAESGLREELRRVQECLGVNRATEGDLNGLNRVVRRGAETLGWRGAIQCHNRIACPGCTAACVLGCPWSAPGIGKQSMAVTYVPRALAAGARVYTDCLAEQVLAEDGRVVGVSGRIVGDDGRAGPAVTVRSRAVVLAAGATHSPMLWRASGLPDLAGQAGRNLHLHPAIFVGGFFAEEVCAYEGIPQAYYVDEFLDLARDPESGYLLMPIFAPPAMVAGSQGGMGVEHRAKMRRFWNMAAMLVLLHDRTAGEVWPGRDGRPVIRYRLEPRDRTLLVEGLLHATELLLAAGAEEVGVPYCESVSVRRGGDLGVFSRRGIVDNDILIAASHPQSTLRMGKDPRESVVDERGRAHGVRGLYVADTSLFPTSVGVPPTLTTAALADWVAQGLAAEWPP